MPFDPQAVQTLMKREGFSYRELVSAMKEQDPSSEYNISKSYLSDILTGDQVNPSINFTDRLYQFARTLGHDDLAFYKPPVQIPVQEESIKSEQKKPDNIGSLLSHQ